MWKEFWMELHVMNMDFPFALLIINGFMNAIANEDAYITLSTDDNKIYVLLSNKCIVASNRHYLEFQVKAKNDAHVALMETDTASTYGNFYEIVIGGWGNKKSCLRMKGQGQCSLKNTPQILSEIDFRTFWVGWQNGQVQLGKGSFEDKNIVSSINPSNPYNVTYAAVMTGWGASGQWRFNNDVSCHQDTYNNTFLESNDTSCNGVTKYECKTGYYLSSGSLQRTCVKGRQWEGDPPVCKAITCPAVTTDASYEILIDDVNINGNVTVVCRKGYRHQSGDLTRKCLSDGSWGGNAPHCRKCKCPCQRIQKLKVFNSSKELEKRIDNIRKELRVLENKTSNFLRSKISSKDSRQSATGIGWILGYGILISVLLTIVISDIPLVIHQMRTMRRFRL